jgi:predicted nucleic acid-binding protein
VVAEVLGFQGLSQEDTAYFREFFDTMRNYPLNEAVTKEVIVLRKSHRIQLPDAIVAATAIVNDLTLWTHNAADFKNLGDLRLADPLAGGEF